MTLHEKVQARIEALMYNHNKVASGLVVDQETYCSIQNDGYLMYATANCDMYKGDTYLGLSVSISTADFTLVVY